MMAAWTTVVAVEGVGRDELWRGSNDKMTDIYPVLTVCPTPSTHLMPCRVGESSRLPYRVGTTLIPSLLTEELRLRDK